MISISISIASSIWTAAAHCYPLLPSVTRCAHCIWLLPAAAHCSSLLPAANPLPAAACCWPLPAARFCLLSVAARCRPRNAVQCCPLMPVRCSGRSSVEAWSKPVSKPGSKPGRSLVEARSKHDRSLVEAWSKHGRSLFEAWPKPGQSLVETWSKPGPLISWPTGVRAGANLFAQPPHARSMPSHHYTYNQGLEAHLIDKYMRDSYFRQHEHPLLTLRSLIVLDNVWKC